MLAFLTPLTLLAQAPDCPTDETAYGRMRIRTGEASCAEQAAEIAKQQIPPRKTTQAEKQRIIARFDDLLVDGPSARWKWGDVVRGSVACFSVNSKNRMGGYTGWTRYSFDLETGDAQNLDSFSELADMLETMGQQRPIDVCA